MKSLRLMFWIWLTTCWAWGDDPTHLQVEVDFGRPLGAFRRLSGVQGSPYPMAVGDVKQVQAFHDYSIDLCRFPQDCEPNTLTLSGIFPNSAADPLDPASFHFEAIDRHMRAAQQAGCRVLWQTSYDVGGSDRWIGFNLGGRAPRDLPLWGKVVRGCLNHFNHGWKQGLKHSVSMVEFVNEPDGLGGFQKAERARLIPAFLFFLQQIRDHNLEHPDFPVVAVGPGVPLSWDRWSVFRPQFDLLLLEMKRQQVELPVFSFHTYGQDTSPPANRRLAAALRRLLDQRGFSKTRLMNSEWQATDYLKDCLQALKASGQRPTGEYGMAAATYAVACKIGWQGIVDESCYYLANRRCYASGETPPRADLGLFFPPQGRPTRLADQEKLLNHVSRVAGLRCYTQDAPARNLFALGLRADGGRHRLVLLCNLSAQSRVCRLRCLDEAPREVSLFTLGSSTPKSVAGNPLEIPMAAATTCWVEWDSSR